MGKLILLALLCAFPVLMTNPVFGYNRVYRSVLSKSPISEDYVRVDGRGNQGDMYLIESGTLYLKIELIGLYPLWQEVKQFEWDDDEIRMLLHRNPELKEFFPDEGKQCGGVAWLCQKE
ncbi:hypothetical protein [Teredinibacter sp. KSP-S5-2]|uniref:hypothetical protein n=1 Tax=Teredinibacter sp. KSP-S5-2 TaxID=3034506 RepID=UPI002934FD18|nr:hypothetical protein [Teredinibacter sp. KSP-S5-2]WNO10973.1 hypothetical protein P5V12_07260 [Teredinibacter sp. KSP-S5-2]